MRVEICDPRSVEVNLSLRLQVITAVLSRGHVWLGPDPEEEWFQPFLADLGAVAEYFTTAFYKQQAWGAQSSGRLVSISESQEGCLSMAIAGDLLTRPLEILVENSLGDGELLRTMLICSAPWIEEDFDSGRVRFAHSGGKADAINQLTVRVKDFERSRVPLHVVVIVDSDSKFLQDPGVDTKKVRDKCEELGVRLHVLHKRKIENYLPDRILDSYANRWTDRHVDVTFVKSLNREQRDFHPMKEALNTKGKGAWSYQQAVLFAGVGVDELDRRKLPNIADHAIDVGWTCSTQDLLERNANNEIAEIIQMIEDNY